MGLARWENHHPIHWEVLDHGRGQELLVKEALHVKMTPSEDRFNRVPGCWSAGRSNPRRPLTSSEKKNVPGARSFVCTHFLNFNSSVSENLASVEHVV